MHRTENTWNCFCRTTTYVLSCKTYLWSEILLNFKVFLKLYRKDFQWLAKINSSDRNWWKFHLHTLDKFSILETQIMKLTNAPSVAQKKFSFFFQRKSNTKKHFFRVVWQHNEERLSLMLYIPAENKLSSFTMCLSCQFILRVQLEFNAILRDATERTRCMCMSNEKYLR